MSVCHDTIYKKFLAALLCYNHSASLNKRFMHTQSTIQRIPLEMVYEIWKWCMSLYNYPIQRIYMQNSLICPDRAFPPDINLNKFIEISKKNVLFGFYSATHARLHDSFEMQLYQSKYDGVPPRNVKLTLASTDWFPYQHHNYKDVVFMGYVSPKTAKGVGYGDGCEYYDYRITTRIERNFHQDSDNKVLRHHQSKYKGVPTRLRWYIPEDIQNIYIEAINNYKF